MGELFQPTHLLLIAIVAIIFFGPRKLPELGKGLGEAIRGFRDGMSPSAPEKDTKKDGE
jgi:sec-independent protein translocase protein TatA